MSADGLTGGRAGRLAGLITLTGVVLWGAALAVLGTDRRRFNDLVDWTDAAAVRVVLGVVVGAATLHLIDGLGRMRSPGGSERWRALAWFGAFAAGIPATAVLVWPAVERAAT